MQVKKKKLTFVIADLSKSSGGPQNEVASLTAVIAQSSAYEVQIVSYPSADPIEIDPGVKIVTIPRGMWNVFYSLRLFRAILMGSDFIYVWGIWGPLEGLAFRFIKPRSKPYAVKTLGMLENYILKRNAYLKKVAKFLYVNHNLNQAKAILVDSFPEKNQVTSLDFKTDKVVCRNGVKLRDGCYHRNERDILYMGRIVPKKRLDFFLDVLSCLVKRQPDLRLLVAGGWGDPEYRKQVEGKIEQLNLASRVLFMGSVDGTEKDCLLGSVGCFVLPSYSEGFSNAVLESLSAGTPVFITPGCNFPEVAANGLGYVLDHQVELWVTTLDRFFANRAASGVLPADEIRNHMRENFNWQNAAGVLVRMTT